MFNKCFQVELKTREQNRMCANRKVHGERQELLDMYFNRQEKMRLVLKRSTFCSTKYNTSLESGYGGDTGGLRRQSC